MTSDDRVQRLKQALAPQDEGVCEICLSQLADYVSPHSTDSLCKWRATTAGTFKVLPLQSYAMYDSEAMGRTGSMEITVKEK